MKSLADKVIGCKHCLGQWLPAKEVFNHVDRLKESLCQRLIKNKSCNICINCKEINGEFGELK